MSRQRRKKGRALRVPSLPWPDGRRIPHRAMRVCAGCGQRDGRASLQRIARCSGSRALEWREHDGRGTYLHPEAHCEQLFAEGRKSLLGLRVRPDGDTRRALLATRAPQTEAREKD